MDKNIQIINTIITQLDQLTVQGARNMTIILQSIQALAALKENLSEVQNNVQDKAE